jgi:predicted transcriptional regulator
MLTNELMGLGLSLKEADVYVTTLQLGHASIAEISSKAKIIRTSTYTIMKNLISRGLINSIERCGKILYVAERPDKLVTIYSQQEKELERKRELIKDLVPQLESIYSIEKSKPIVKYFDYDDEKGLKELRSHVQKLRNNRVYNIFNYEKYKGYVNKRYFTDILNNASNYQLLYIANREDIDHRIKDFIDKENFEIKYLPADQFGFLCEITIFDDYVFVARDRDALMLEDKLFGHTMGLLFQTMWSIGQTVTDRFFREEQFS